MPARVDSIHIYPLKSCAPLRVDDARVDARGLQYDRRWMIVGTDGKFLTGREHPHLTLIRAEPDLGGLRLDAPQMPPLTLTIPPQHERVDVTVWRSRVSALAADVEADRWITGFLGCPARFVHMDDSCVRPVNPQYGVAGDQVSFADGYPLLLISQASLDQLNVRLNAPVSMLRFRPNLVVGGTAEHAEDAWKRIRVGSVEFDVVKPCTRCVFTTVDFEHGAFDPSGEPLRTLLRYRRGAQGVSFGQNLIPRGSGQVRVGDGIRILEMR